MKNMLVFSCLCLASALPLAASDDALADQQNLEAAKFIEELLVRPRRDVAAKDLKSRHILDCIGCRDPECRQDTCQIAASKGYPCESHAVTTADNINITIFRLPHGRNTTNSNQQRPVVFLQHGLLSSSADWVINFPSQSLGFLMADAGFDVWLGNVRGNTYGLASLPTDDEGSKAFWRFSFDEMAHYDLPAMVDAALLVSNASQLAAYIAHSQGSSIGLIRFSQHPRWAEEKIGAFYALAPIAHMGRTTSPLRYVAALTQSPLFVRILQKLLGGYELLPSSRLIDTLCAVAPETICGNTLALIAGYDFRNTNNSRLPVYASKDPAGTSVQNVVHFGQLIRTGRFQAYDFLSPHENQKRYGQSSPPIYNVSSLSVPTTLYSGSADTLADPDDVRELSRELPGVRAVEVKDADHLDFVWGLRAREEVYEPIIDELRNKHGMM